MPAYMCVRVYLSDAMILTQQPAEQINYCRSIYMWQRVPSVACGMPATNFLEVEGTEQASS